MFPFNCGKLESKVEGFDSYSMKGQNFLKQMTALISITISSLFYNKARAKYFGKCYIYLYFDKVIVFEMAGT